MKRLIFIVMLLFVMSGVWAAEVGGAVSFDFGLDRDNNVGVKYILLTDKPLGSHYVSFNTVVTSGKPNYSVSQLGFGDLIYLNTLPLKVYFALGLGIDWLYSYTISQKVGFYLEFGLLFSYAHVLASITARPNFGRSYVFIEASLGYTLSLDTLLRKDT